MRETHSETEIPTPVENIPYLEPEQIVRGVLKHGVEMFAGRVTGADGEGADLTGIPFEPAAVVVYNLDAGTPFLQYAAPGRLGTADEQVHIGSAAGAASDAIPEGEKQEDGTWTLSIPTEIAGNDAVVEVLVIGFRDADGSL